ncbi:unnamed protein product [Scytosiphon promiscuus]
MIRLVLAMCILLLVVEAATAAAGAGAGAAATSLPDDTPSPPIWPVRFHALMSQVDHEDYGVVDLWYDYPAGRNLNVIQTQGGEADGPLFSNEQANGTSYYYHPAKPKEEYCDVMDFGVGIITPDWLKDATYLGEEQCGIYQCTKWEQGDLPEAHARFLGLRTVDVETWVHPSQRGAVTGDKSQGKLDRNLAAGRVEKALLSVAASAGMGWSRDTAEAQDQEGSASLRDRGGGAGDSEEKAWEAGTGDRFLTYWSEKGTDRPVKWRFFTGALFQVVRVDEGAILPDAGYQIPAYCFED